ncbi:MAG: transglutaminase domain-containing protein [Deltaproteobacteria bacterium]|nr:transglutaminase domain-containing protein [Deltaproteobacteria bacterium]
MLKRISQQRVIVIVQLTRIITALVISGLAADIYGLTLNIFAIHIAITCGILAAYPLFRSTGKIKLLFLMVVATISVGYISFNSINTYFVDSAPLPGNEFELFLVFEQCKIIFWTLLISLLSTWLFWRFQFYILIEGIGLIAFVVYMFSPHRNYFLDAPQQIGIWAWHLNLETQILFILFGIGCTVLYSFYYLFLGTFRVSLSSRDIITYSQKKSVIVSILFCVMLFAVFYSTYLILVNRLYSNNLSRVMNGVGKESEVGKSPLGFHSSLGQSKQPAALVRLETDYSENPWEPLLYLRENALSDFNGKELVIAPPQYDRDILGSDKQADKVDKKPYNKKVRQEVTQSIFVLVSQQGMFSIDYPLYYRLLKNPDSRRFVTSYQVLSAAPSTKLDNIDNLKFGDSKWNKETWDHYLRAPGQMLYTPNANMTSYSADLTHPIYNKDGEDQRYLILAHEITQNISNPLKQAYAIINYLSENSIYTRNPNHNVTETGDPVAAYLFAKEKRGYCVHFSHAAVYMLRAIGIPARIATGYLTDLTFAKDGHILLQMADRHAWPEVYIEDYGWISLDISPAKAENEQVLEPDRKLLEELMEQVSHDIEFDSLNPLTIPEQRTSSPVFITYSLHFYYCLMFLLLLLIAAKLFLRLLHLLPCPYRLKVRLLYFSALCLLSDLGIIRNFGETRQEFATRIHNLHALDLENLTMLFEEEINKKVIHLFDQQQSRSASQIFVASWQRQFSLEKRMIGVFNIFTLFRLRSL